MYWIATGVLILLLGGAWVVKSKTTPNDSPPEAVTRNGMTYLALGDSYTISESVAPSERWPVRLVQRLRESGKEFSDPLIIARTGWTSDELLEAIDLEKPKGPFSLVSILIGVNNQFRGLSREEYRLQLRRLLQLAVEFAGGR